MPKSCQAVIVHAMRHPERWLAGLRIAVGLWFLKSILTKLTVGFAWGVVPYPAVTARWGGFLPPRLAEYAEGNTFGAYRAFLEDVAIPNADVFAVLTAYGETTVGLGLVLGLLTPLAAAIGFLLMTAYFLASFWQGPGAQGFHLLLMACMLVFAGAGAGRRGGLDALLLTWLRRRGQTVRARTDAARVAPAG
jgi:thiosulfate dehydrogenase (quinone) large subunit